MDNYKKNKPESFDRLEKWIIEQEKNDDKKNSYHNMKDKDNVLIKDGHIFKRYGFQNNYTKRY